MKSFALSLAAALGAAVCVSAQEIAPTDLYDLPPADVYILGERHDNAVHHAHQAIAVEAVGAAALVFEMLTDVQALTVTPEMRRDPERLGTSLEWEASGWPDFEMYYPIFVAAPDAPIFGGAVPRDDVRRAVADGAAAVMGEAALVFGLDQPLPEAQQLLREAGQMSAHCDALPADMLPGMVEAQRLRDAAMARAVIAAVADTGGPVVLITGNGHARTDWGVPAALALAAPELSVVSIGQFEDRDEDTPYDRWPYDRWIVTEPAARDDPCAAFR
ncbi:ChaN family lipoprotein [Anianabacter salinae]|uniref:ChaN family lipoprotein n=1 Tax=Anianabacter salinae TaxID=2851023 RepID=UPI00225DEF06|nr:ChaN family lipoprotein [Anianabacter salinae]MBV0913951.1 ChaN family lipoprotein [Anianabacter salinae]